MLHQHLLSNLLLRQCPQNITIAAPSVLDEPEVLWGMSDGLIYDLVFDNVVIGEEKIDTIDQFYHNEYVLPLVVP